MGSASPSPVGATLLRDGFPCQTKLLKELLYALLIAKGSNVFVTTTGGLTVS